MSVLPDTSIWVEYLREGQRGYGAGVERLLAADEVVICGPVAAELLTGTKSEDRYKLWDVLRALTWAPLGQGEWLRVGEVASELRQAGITLPLTDIEIAVCAVSSEARLWTHDKDFDRIVRAFPELHFYEP